MQRLGFVIMVGIILTACTPASPAVESSGRVVAGPVCPVERQPPDPACADRPVAGATLVVQDSSGAEVGRFTSNATGLFTLRLRPGAYLIVPQPMSSLPGTASPVEVNVQATGTPEPITISYDTGIR